MSRTGKHCGSMLKKRWGQSVSLCNCALRLLVSVPLGLVNIWNKNASLVLRGHADGLRVPRLPRQEQSTPLQANVNLHAPRLDFRPLCFTKASRTLEVQLLGQ